MLPHAGHWKGGESGSFLAPGVPEPRTSVKQQRFHRYRRPSSWRRLSFVLKTPFFSRCYSDVPKDSRERTEPARRGRVPRSPTEMSEYPLREVIEAAKKPKQNPEGAPVVDLVGDAAMEYMRTHKLKSKPWHEELTEAQQVVCRWIWDICARHLEPFEQFEAGFLFDYNNNHELRLWARIALCFEKFVSVHPSVNKRDVVVSLTQLSIGARVTLLRGDRAKELTRMWNDGDF